MNSIIRKLKYCLNPITREKTIPEIPDKAVGVPLLSHRQTREYDCGSAVVFTALCTRCWLRGQPVPTTQDYPCVDQVVGAHPEDGTDFPQVEKGLKYFGIGFEHRKFRLPVLRKALGEGAFVLACIPWGPEFWHWVAISAIQDRKVLMGNLPRSKSWGWLVWEEFRPNSFDDMLVIHL